MKTNKILAVALSAGLVLGGASVAHAGQSGGSSSGPVVEEKQPADLDKAIKDAEAELKKAEGELAEAKDELAELWAEGANAGSDDDTNPLAAEFEAKSKEVENLEIKVAEAKTKLDKAKAEKGKKELEDAAKKEAEEEAYREKLNQAKADAIYELKNAGITSDLLLKQIEKAKTIEGVEALKNEILKSHEASKPEEEVTIKVYFHKPFKSESYFDATFKGKQSEATAEAYRYADLIAERDGFRKDYRVEVSENGLRLDVYFNEKEEKPGKSIPWTELTPANPIVPTPGYPTPAPGGDNEVVIPGEKPADKPEEKPEDNKGTEIEKEKPNEGKDKDEKAKPSKDKKEEAKPAKQKGNNPKTGLVGLAPIYSTLAISMAGIVAARKKND